MKRTEINKQTFRSLIAAADAGDLAAVKRCYSPAYVDHDPPAARRSSASDLEGTMRAFRMFRAAFPDVRHTLHDLIAEGDRVVARISAEGTHQGEIFGFAPTGRRLATDSIVIYRLEDGRIVERWCRESCSIRDQLIGAKAGPGSAPAGEDTAG